MALTEEQKQRIAANINRLDYLEGTGVISGHRKHLAREFFVFISAGGVGRQALARLKKTIKNKVDNIEMDKQTMFLAIDTDHHQLDESVSKGEFEQQEVLKIPYVGAHDSINPEKILPQLKVWVHDKLWEKTGGTNETSPAFNGTGAGAIRQCGRVLFSQSAVQNELYRKLSRMPKLLAKMETAPMIKVFFLSGIAGGTGSGIILDLAFLTRHFLKNILQSAYDKTTFSAYLFLPSACGDASGMKLDDVTNGNRNAYAALKEIDHYMTMTNRSERFTMDYGTVEAGNVDIGDDIFNFCTLVEGMGTDGVFFKDRAETSRQIVADSILDIICADNQKLVEGQSMFLVDSFLSNKTAQVEQRIEARSDKVWPRDTNYIYSVIGYSSCVVPVDLLTVYVVKKIFDEVFRSFVMAEEADEDRAIAFLEDCGMDSKSLGKVWRTISKKQMFSNIQAQADVEFKRAGPFYMVNLTRKASQMILTAPDIYLNEATKKENWIIADKNKWKKIRQCYTEAAAYLDKINIELYEVYSYVIRVLKELIEKNAGLLTDVKEYENQFDKSFCWSPIDMTPGEQATKAVIEYLDEILDEKTVKLTAQKFMNELCEKRDEWTGVNVRPGEGVPKLDIAKAVRNFIADNLQVCINTTLEQFIVKAYSGKKDAPVFVMDQSTGKEICSEETKEAAGEVFERLSYNANALASTRGYRLSDCYSNIYLTVPDNCKWFYEAISKAANADSGTDSITVYQSSARDRVVLCRLYTGVPAWALYWTPYAEEAYEGSNGDGVKAVGIHMSQGEGGIDWAELPNLYPEKLWTEAQRKRRKREENISTAIRTDMKRAEELYMLTPDTGDKKFYDVFLLDKEIEAEELLTKAELDIKKKYDLKEILQILQNKGYLKKFKIEFINQVMSTNDKLSEEELREFRLEIAGRTLRRFAEQCELLHKTVPVIERLNVLNNERTPVNMGIMTIFINSLKWEILNFDGRRNIWMLQLGDEKPIGKRLEDKCEQQCAHYYGYQAFSSLDADALESIHNRIEELEGEATDTQLEEREEMVSELKQSLTELRNAKKKTVSPWKSDSPFKSANESAWPMATQDFVERVGNGETVKVIREFYTALIDNM